MASSAVSHALEDVLEMIDEEVDVQDTRDDEKALFENAQAVLDDYKAAAGADAARLADHVRSWLAQVLQYVNEEMPELIGSMELRNAQQVLSSPHLPASDVAQGGEPALTPNEPGPVPDAPVGEDYASEPRSTAWEESDEEYDRDEQEKAAREAEEAWGRAKSDAAARGEFGSEEADERKYEECIEPQSTASKRTAKKGKK